MSKNNELSVGSDAYMAGMEKAASQANTEVSGRDIIKLSPDTGVLRFGEHDTLLDDKNVLAVNPATIRHGYIAFTSSLELASCTDLTGHTQDANFSWSLAETLPDIGELAKVEPEGPNKIPPYKYFIAIEINVIDGPNTGAKLIYSNPSVGGVQMTSKINAEIIRRWKDNKTTVPIGYMTSDFYFNKSKGNKKTFFPLFVIEEWKAFEHPVKDDAQPL